MKHDFKPYLNPVFIETGSAGGEGIEAALEAGYPVIYSVELNEFAYRLCKRKFDDIKNVNLLYGDSVTILLGLLRIIDKRCTFWLDAHYCGEGSAGKINSTPIMEELKIIAQHHIKNHTIIIDDIRLLRDKTLEWKDVSFTVEDVEEVIHSINPAYKITYDFGVVEQDILIAQI